LSADAGAGAVRKNSTTASAVVICDVFADDLAAEAWADMGEESGRGDCLPILFTDVFRRRPIYSPGFFCPTKSHYQYPWSKVKHPQFLRGCKEKQPLRLTVILELKQFLNHALNVVVADKLVIYSK
jgi:hypothetical protein